MAHTVAKFASTFFRDKHGKVAIVQFPNLPLIGWFVSMVVSNVMASGPTKVGFTTLSTAFLFAWSYLEIRHGDSYFRRALGTVVMIGILFGLFC